jgi:peptide/nickel transport system substrate-binding protein
MRKLIIALGLVAVAAAAWFMVPRGAPAPSEQRASVSSGPKTLRVGVVTLPPDRGYPYNSTGIPTIYTYRAIFDGLTFVAADGQVLPYLATSWEQVDPLTWRFKLRQGVTFHNGVPFTADAVVFAIQFLTRPGAVIDAIARELVGIASAESEGPHSVLIKTTRPEPLLPASMEQLLMVEPGQFQRLGQEGFAAAPIGTGPFKVVRWDEAKIELAAFTESWRAPKVDTLEIIPVPETSARVQAILSNQIDIAVAMGHENIVELQQAGAAYHITPTNSVIAVTFIFPRLPPSHPLHDRRVRHALNYAVDKASYTQALFGGLVKPASQPATASGFGYDPSLTPYPYDPAKAKALLAEAGVPNGFSFTVELTPAGGTGLSETYQQVAADLAKVGVNMVIRTITLPQLLRGVQQGEWSGDAFNMNFSAERTRDSLRAVRMHSCINRNPWYCDKAVTDKIQTAYATGDLAVRERLTREIMAHYHDEAPGIWLHEVTLFEGLSKRVRDFQNDHTVIRYDLIELAD